MNLYYGANHNNNNGDNDSSSIASSDESRDESDSSIASDDTSNQSMNSFLGGNEIEEFSLIDFVYAFDSDYEDLIKPNGHLCLGFYDYKDYELLLGMSISTLAFFKFPFALVYEYLRKYSIWRLHSKQVHIMKVVIKQDLDDFEISTVILKTFWLKLVQRTWKRIYKERQRVLQLRKRLKTQDYVRIYGKYPTGCRNWPCLHGMLYGI